MRSWYRPGLGFLGDAQDAQIGGEVGQVVGTVANAIVPVPGLGTVISQVASLIGSLFGPPPPGHWDWIEFDNQFNVVNRESPSGDAGPSNAPGPGSVSAVDAVVNGLNQVKTALAAQGLGFKLPYPYVSLGMGGNNTSELGYYLSDKPFGSPSDGIISSDLGPPNDPQSAFTSIMQWAQNYIVQVPGLAQKQITYQPPGYVADSATNDLAPPVPFGSTVPPSQSAAAPVSQSSAAQGANFSTADMLMIGGGTAAVLILLVALTRR